MEVGIQDIVVNIKRKYLNIRADHLKQYPYHLKDVAELELVEEEKDNIHNLFDQLGNGNTCTDQVHSITYTRLFNKGQYGNMSTQGKKLLVLGEAGIGKTILCTSIAEDWANGILFQEFFIVLLLPLCQRNIASVESLPELLNQLCLFNSGDTESCSKNLSSYLTTHENRILIIADEWDKFCESKCSSTDSFLHRLLFGSLFPKTSITVVITARPYSFPSRMLQHIDRFITVRGFSKDTVVECVHSEFSNNMKRISYFLGQLEDNPLVDSMCRVPLNLALICKLTQSFRKPAPFPNTMTGMYKKICWNIARLNILRESDVYKRFVNLSSYRDLPEELQQAWWLLCELAFRNLEKGHDFFSQLEAAMFVSTELESVSYFGFLKSMSQTGFIHPAIEEYLAALHLARQKEEVQLRFIELCTKNVLQHHTHFWRFYFGANETLHSVMNTSIIVQAVQMLSKLHSSDNNEHLLCYCSFEANNKFVNDEVVRALSTTDQSGSVSVNFLNPHNSQDYTAMIHVIESIYIQCSVEINFQNCNLKAKEILRLASALSHCDVSSNVQVKGLDLSDNKLDDTIMVDFFHRTAAALFSLKKLFLRNCGIGTDSIRAITDTLAESSSQSLVQLDLSFNPLSVSSLRTLQHSIESHQSLVRLAILFLKGSLTKGIDMSFFACFIDTLTTRCRSLRRLDLSANNLGKPGNPALSHIISQLTSLRRDFDLCLNPEYMLEVDNNFISVMEESIRNKGTIDHTIAHGIIVGPGRSGKNTLMNRLIGIRPDPDCISPSTGVMETIVKVEVKKMCTVATAVSNLTWQGLEYDEEALELIMTATRDYSVSPSVLKPIHKYIVKKQQMQGTVTNNLAPESCTKTENHTKTESKSSPNRQISKSKVYDIGKFFRRFVKRTSKQPRKTQSVGHESMKKVEETSKNVVVYSSDLAPVDILKRAVKLRRMDALREHLESSWSLYLTNTGGQIEFQEHLSLLACGPSIFFITFPLHHDLEQPYNVQYEYPDGQVKAYQSTATLLEELLQTLATIDALNYGSEQYGDGESNIKPKVFFIGTHRDKLPKITAEEAIKETDKLLQKFVRQTSLFHQGSIQFAQPTKKLIFAVNNLSTDDDEFQKIRSAVQQTVERKQCEDFTVKCPSSWLVFSLILRVKYKSSQVLSFEKCLSIAQECGISDCSELSQALSFIHSKLGLVHYYNVDGLNELVIVDPQILFDRITDLLVNTFTSSHAEVNEIEDFYQKGIFPIAVVERINKKCTSDEKLPFIWLTKLLNYQRIAALFRDHDGKKYFFPSAICHAPEPHSNQQSSSFNSPPRLLIAFESGFCPRGIPGALIKILMTNELMSELPWELLPNRIFRNQVSFGIKAYGDITLKILPTHLEIFLDSNNDITESESSVTCLEAYTQINESMKLVTSQLNKCRYFWGFYCTLDECQAHPHPAKIEWLGSSPSKLKCTITYKRGGLPRGYEVYFFKDALHLNKEIDFCNNGVPKHLGRIADSMYEWEGRIAEELGLTKADVANIKTKYPMDLKLQIREALNMWKQKLGSSGTYNKLIEVFEHAGYKGYADSIRKIVLDIHETNNDECLQLMLSQPNKPLSHDEEDPPLSQPLTYPSLEPLNPSPQLIPLQLSPEEHYVLINEVTAEKLPEGSEVHNQDVLESRHVINVPILQENMDSPNQPLSPSQDQLEGRKTGSRAPPPSSGTTRGKKSKWVSRYRPGVPIVLPGESARESIMQAELRHREDEFCNPKQLRVFCGTWNVNGCMPPADLNAWLLEYQVKDGESPPPDIYAVGFQELDLSAQCLISNESTREEPWIHCVTSTLRKAGSYILVGYHRLVGIMLLVYIKQELYMNITDVESDFIATGLRGIAGNKGGVGIRFNVFHSSFCFVNTHFSAHMKEVKKSNREFKILMDKLQFATAEYSYDISQHDMIFWIGDLNYRVQTSHEMTFEVIKAHADSFQTQTLLKHDQLLNEMKKKNVFCDFLEMPIDFKPTYKYIPGTNDLDSSEKHPPAWCDRILHRGDRVAQRTYISHPPLTISDHKPVSALFDANVRVVDSKKEKEVLEEITWRLNKLENGTLPQVDLNKTEFQFKDVRFMMPREQKLVVTNTGRRPVHISFIPKLDEKNVCKPWLEVKPTSAVIHPLEDAVMFLTVNVDEDTAPALNNGHDLLEDILVLHIQKGKDVFITVSGNYLPSCFGSSLKTLVHLHTYIRKVPVAQLVALSSSWEQCSLPPPAGSIQEASMEQVPPPLDIPKELFTMVDFIKRKGAQEEGLFSDGGRSAEIEDIMNMLDTGGRELPGSTFSVASALLTFLAALADPVVPFALHQRCMEVYNNTTFCKQVLTQMPKVHRRTFVFLITFMKHLLKYSEANGLDPKVLATIFGEVMLKTPLEERKSRNKRTINAMNRKKAAFIHQFLVNDLTKPYN